MGMMEEIKDAIRNAGGEFTTVVELIVKRSLEELEALGNEDFVFLMKVLSKIKGKKVDPKIYHQAVYKMNLVQSRSGPRKVAFQAGYQEEEDFQAILQRARDEGATAVHIKVDHRPFFRQGRVLKEIKEEKVISESHLQTLIANTLTSVQFAEFKTHRSVDFSLSLAGISRFRVSVYMEEGNPAICFKQIPLEVPSLEDVGLDTGFLEKIMASGGGLVLVGGTARSGKSTTAAAILQAINTAYPKRILTLEDPIEYLFHDEQSSITQRELGSDFNDMGQGLRSALKSGSDIIFLSAINTRTELEWALTAAETGTLVMVTAMGNTCRDLIESFLGMVDKEERYHYQDRLSRVSLSFTCQRLCPTPTGTLMPVHEILMPDAGARTMIRDNNLTPLVNYMDQSVSPWIRSFVVAFKEKLEAGVLALEDILEQCPDPEKFRQRHGQAEGINPRGEI